MIKFIIKNKDNNPLPSYNEYIDKCRYNRFAGATFKKKYQEFINNQIRDKFYIDKPFYLDLHIVERSNRRDKDNVESMAKKLILDTLQQYKYISNDKLYMGGSTTFGYEKNNGYIEVKLYDKESIMEKSST